MRRWVCWIVRWVARVLVVVRWWDRVAFLCVREAGAWRGWCRRECRRVGVERRVWRSVLLCCV